MTQKSMVVQDHQIPPTDAGGHVSASLVPTHDDRIPGHWLPIGRAGWLIVTLVAVVLTAAGLPILGAPLRSVCLQGTCYFQFTDAQIRQLQSLGLSVSFFVFFSTISTILLTAFYIFVASIIFLRQSDHWVGLLGSFTLVLFGAVTITAIPMAVGNTNPALHFAANILGYLSHIAFPLFFFSFPDGRLKPRWTIGLVPIWAILRFPYHFFPDSPLNLDRWPDWLQLCVWVGLIGSLISVQYYRYRRLYGPILRQQTKWVVYGLMVSLGGVAVVFSVSAARSLRDQIPVMIAGNVAMDLLWLIIPVSMAIAMLRYRLWDIDLIINRTLVYVPLTAILAGLYASVNTLFQKLFVATTGQKSDAAIVLATLIIASTFTPIKNGMQIAVDKRFKEPADPLKELRAFDNQVRSVVEVLDSDLITRRLLHTATTAFRASGGAVYLGHGGQMRLEQASPEWKDEERRLSLPLEWNGRQLGLLCLGGRVSGKEYSRQELQVLQETANRVAQAIGESALETMPGDNSRLQT